MACHDFVPTLSILIHRNLAPNDIYPCCSYFDENFLYCIRDYAASMNIWHHLGFVSTEFFNNMDHRN